MLKPVAIETNEWWYRGCFIQYQDHPNLLPYYVFKDNHNQEDVGTYNSFPAALRACQRNEVKAYAQGYASVTVVGRQVYYKIVRRTKDDRLKFLYHGVNRSRELPIRKWMVADIKRVRDGKGTMYWSGFHIFRLLEHAGDYLNRFRKRDDLVIAPVFAYKISAKPTNPSVLLADRIMVI